MAEENPDEIAYTITKYLEDGQTITEHSSRNYTGKASVVYATKDKYEGDFKDGLREGVGTYTYFKEEGPQSKYEGEWLQNKKHGIGKIIYGENHKCKFIDDQGEAVNLANQGGICMYTCQGEMINNEVPVYVTYWRLSSIDPLHFLERVLSI
jgi:hypothetical protein